MSNLSRQPSNEEKNSNNYVPLRRAKSIGNYPNEKSSNAVNNHEPLSRTKPKGYEPEENIGKHIAPIKRSHSNGYIPNENQNLQILFQRRTTSTFLSNTGIKNTYNKLFQINLKKQLKLKAIADSEYIIHNANINAENIIYNAQQKGGIIMENALELAVNLSKGVFLKKRKRNNNLTAINTNNNNNNGDNNQFPSMSEKIYIEALKVAKTNAKKTAGKILHMAQIKAELIIEDTINQATIIIGQALDLARSNGVDANIIAQSEAESLRIKNVNLIFNKNNKYRNLNNNILNAKIALSQKKINNII